MKLLCIGDSLTFGYGIPRRKCWTSLAEGLTGADIVNYGINGDTAEGMLVRMRTEILPLFADKRESRAETIVMVMGGYNDIFCTGSDLVARSAMAALIQQLLSAGIYTVVGIPPELMGETCPELWERLADMKKAGEIICEYNDWLCRYCAVFGIRYVDFRGSFKTAAGEPDRALYLDGIHPNAIGHSMMAARVAKLIKELEQEV